MNQNASITTIDWVCMCMLTDCLVGVLSKLLWLEMEGVRCRRGGNDLLWCCSGECSAFWPISNGLRGISDELACDEFDGMPGDTLVLSCEYNKQILPNMNEIATCAHKLRSEFRKGQSYLGGRWNRIDHQIRVDWWWCGRFFFGFAGLSHAADTFLGQAWPRFQAFMRQPTGCRTQTAHCATHSMLNSLFSPTSDSLLFCTSAIVWPAIFLSILLYIFYSS